MAHPQIISHMYIVLFIMWYGTQTYNPGALVCGCLEPSCYHQFWIGQTLPYTVGSAANLRNGPSIYVWSIMVPRRTETRVPLQCVCLRDSETIYYARAAQAQRRVWCMNITRYYSWSIRGVAFVAWKKSVVVCGTCLLWKSWFSLYSALTDPCQFSPVIQEYMCVTGDSLLESGAVIQQQCWATGGWIGETSLIDSFMLVCLFVISLRAPF